MKADIMKFEFVIDSYAWIEYFKGSESGKKARSYIEESLCATSTVTLAELQEKYLREKWNSFLERDLSFISTRSTLISIDRQVALLAGQINYSNKKSKKDWGMSDSLILATARINSAKVVTGDPHFRGLPETVLI
jgi:predicted nucleic acid-binding protein